MTTVFTQTTIVTADTGRTVLHERALAVDGDVIAAIGPTEELLRAYPQAEVYDGRGKALLPGLINCHAHLTATLNRGITGVLGKGA
jgi:5-methylthioadenosine/S-adenosylhomocysteine deaminase